MKEESSSESDEDFHPSDGSDERPRVNKRQKNKRKKPQSDDEASDIDESPSSEDSDVSIIILFICGINSLICNLVSMQGV